MRPLHIGKSGLLASLMASLLVCGCVTRQEFKEDRALAETRLFVTRSEDQVTLSWESRPDMAYTVMHNSTRSSSSPWLVLPGFDYIRGTGRTLTYQDRVPVDQPRYYRLSVQPAVNLPR